MSDGRVAYYRYKYLLVWYMDWDDEMVQIPGSREQDDAAVPYFPNVSMASWLVSVSYLKVKI